MNLSTDKKTLNYVSDCDIPYGRFTIPNSVTHIRERAFYLCTGLLIEVTIPSSVTNINISAFHNCNNLRTIVIEAPNEQEYMRIKALLPQESHHLIIPFELVKDIKVAKDTALMSMAPNVKNIKVTSPLSSRLSRDMINQIYKHDARFHDVLNQVLLPRQPDELHLYEKVLKKALSQFWHEQETPIAISKLQKVITKTEEAIEGAKRRPGFFDSPKNKSNLNEGQSRIHVTKKLIQWLEGDQTVSFTKVEKALLSNPNGSVACIVENHGINLARLPEQGLPLVIHLNRFRLCTFLTYILALSGASENNTVSSALVLFGLMTTICLELWGPLNNLNSPGVRH